MKLVTAAEMRMIEDRAEASGVPKSTLMENAGLAVAQELWMQLGSLEDRRICVLVGPGNNGGDGLVAARHLREWGAQVRCYALRPRDDEQWQRVIDAGVAYREDTDEVTRLLEEIGAELREDPEFAADLPEPLEVMGVQALADSAVVVRVRLKTSPGRQWAVSREFNRRMKRRFDDHGIEIPFPHRTVYFGEDKEGQAPPLRLGRHRPARRPDDADP